MGVLDKKFHILRDMDVDDDRGVVLNIKLQIVEVFNTISKLFDSLLEG